jgi:hypothetical protein
VTPARRVVRRIASVLVVGVLAVTASVSGVTSAGAAGGASGGSSGGAAAGGAGGAAARASGAAGSVPVYAYFYQWFNTSSWSRAKQDFPLAGKYTSDDPHVLRSQVRQAQAAGIGGFLTSWKRTDVLNRRLDLLLRVARDEHFGVGVVYEALDFGRRPLPVETVEADMTYLVQRWGTALSVDVASRPVIIWTGTDQYSVQDVQRVRSALAGRAELLAAAKSVAGYERIAGLVDGNAYYWSSADPTSAATSRKLADMGAAVHAHHGLWLAPAASGFDGRTLGHTRVIPRNGGATLRQSLANAFASSPDAVGVISWNEWSENTYIEPGQRYRGEEVRVLREYLAARTPGGTPDQGQAGPPVAPGWWTGLRAAVALTVICAVGLIVLLLVPHRPHRPHRHRRRRHTTDPRDDRELSNART